MLSDVFFVMIVLSIILQVSEGCFRSRGNKILFAATAVGIIFSIAFSVASSAEGGSTYRANSQSAESLYKVVSESMAYLNPKPANSTSSLGSIALTGGDTVIIRPAGGTEHRFKVTLPITNIRFSGSITSDNKGWCFQEYAPERTIIFKSYYGNIYNQRGVAVSDAGSPSICLNGVAYGNDGIEVLGRHLP